MATEILAVPEQHLADVIRVIRLGMGCVIRDGVDVHFKVLEQLGKWCDEEQEYLDDMASGEDTSDITNAEAVREAVARDLVKGFAETLVKEYGGVSSVCVAGFTVKE